MAEFCANWESGAYEAFAPHRRDVGPVSRVGFPRLSVPVIVATVSVAVTASGGALAAYAASAWSDDADYVVVPLVYDPPPAEGVGFKVRYTLAWLDGSTVAPVREIVTFDDADDGQSLPTGIRLKSPSSDWRDWFVSLVGGQRVEQLIFVFHEPGSERGTLFSQAYPSAAELAGIERDGFLKIRTPAEFAGGGRRL
ncbi:MAG: hypothetical protein AAF532_13190 [Planctomycetota bacterium]